jgi:Right handed beta helix region
MRAMGILGLAFAVLACGSDDETSASSGGGQGGTSSGTVAAGGTDSCPPPGRIVGETCLPPGTMDDGCPAGTWGQADGSCLAAGVAACGDGFEPDGAEGCRAILPSAPCVDDMMAVPGDTQCRPIMSCGTGTWGDIPMDVDVIIYVDNNYAGGNSDGSQAQPYTELGQAIAAASGGELIAVAAGGFIQDFVVSKPLTIWGVCPDNVDVFGDPFVGGPALTITAGGSGTTIVGMRFTDLHTAQAILVDGATDVTIDRVRVTSNINGGIDIRHNASAGPASVMISNSLIDGNGLSGVYAWGSTVVIEDSVVRGMEFFGGDQAIAVLVASADDVPTDLTMIGSRIDGGGVFGLHVFGSRATVERSIIQNTVPNPAGVFGRGVNAQYRPDFDLRSEVTLRQSVVEDAFSVGAFAANSDLTIEDSVIQRVAPDIADPGANLVGVQPSSLASDTIGSNLTLRRSRLNDAEGAGVFASGSQVDIESVVVRDVIPDLQGKYGRGVYLRADEGTGQRSEATLRGSIIERSHDVGLITFGSRATVEGTVVKETSADVLSLGGRGVSLQYKGPLDLPSEVTMRGSLVEANSDHGVLVFGSSLAMASSLIRDTAPNSLGGDGRGIGVQPHPGSATQGSLLLTDSAVESSHGIGLFVSGSLLDMSRSVVSGTLPTVAGGGGRGMSLQSAAGVVTAANVVDSIVMDNHEFGVFAAGAVGSVTRAEIHGTRAVDVAGQLVYGDAVAVLAGSQLGIVDSRLHDNARAGVLFFGGDLTLGSNEIGCNAIDLIDGSDDGAANALVNLGDNACGCPVDPAGCKWQSSAVAVPSPLGQADAGDDTQ